MATTVNAASSAIPSLTAEVTVALAEPGEVINRLALYDTAESKGRHTDANLSILRYALERYVISSIEVPAKYRITVEATDESIIVKGVNKSPRRAKTDSFEQEVAYPIWLASFFEDDTHFDLLLPEDTTPLAEVIATLTEYVEEIRADAEDEDEDDDEDEDEDEDDDEDDELEASEEDEEDDEEDDPDEEDDEDDEDDDDEDEDDDEEAEGTATAEGVDTCMPDGERSCTNTLHALEGEHGR